MLTNLFPADQKMHAVSDAIIDELCNYERERRRQLDLPMIPDVEPENDQKTRHGINCDLSKREQEREKLSGDLDRLDFALKSFNMEVWHLDLTNNRCEFTGQSFRMLGIDPSKFDGSIEMFYKAVHPDDRGKLRIMMDLTIEQDVPYRSEYRVIRLDGRVNCITGWGKWSGMMTANC
jgi:PAS domain-containing protein